MKHVLLSTVAAVILLASGSAMAQTDFVKLDVNGAIANQETNSRVNEDEVNNLRSSNTGDVDGTYAGSGIFTTQGVTGFNDAATNGANVATQDAGKAASGAMLNGDLNLVVANQEMRSSVTDSSLNANGYRPSASTGDVDFTQRNGTSIATLQGVTGMNNAATNGLNMAMQTR